MNLFYEMGNYMLFTENMQQYMTNCSKKLREMFIVTRLLGLSELGKHWVKGKPLSLMC